MATVSASQSKYNTMGSWFFGPRGENYELMEQKFEQIVEGVRAGRLQYFPSDPDFITSDMINSADYSNGVQAIDDALKFITQGLADHSVPFFSPRYAGHMSFDVSLPAVLGYLAAMQYNQNNVTPEASPFSSFIEYTVGQELCQMLGYYSIQNPPPAGETITGWGHIVCGGSIANLESMWVARNLKYYPLSLYNAMRPGQPLQFAANSFMTTLCTGESKNFFSCSSWELLNLAPTEVVDLPGRLTAQFGISQENLDSILDQFSIQTVGKDQLDRDFGITLPPQYLLSRANHYSWPKGAAILGVGKANMLELRVDNDARLDLDHLREELDKHLAEQHALYAVTAIIGTTEHGSVDPLQSIIELREEYQAKGLSFVVHADAAWGGYFSSKKKLPLARIPIDIALPEYAFSIPLSDYTNQQMLALKSADSITIDPHKSGYNPYPAGAICYRDGRFRYLTTWTSPYISTTSGDDISMGIYGVEGSKPGAAPVGVWMSLEVLKMQGYSDLLGVAMLTGTKMYCYWATTTLDSTSLVITPFNQLPSEREGGTPDEVYNERVRIREKILLQPNAELEEDTETLAFMRTLGSDLMINAFACNFHIGDKLNTDVVEAGFLNQRLYKRLSITSMEDVLNDKPIVIMATDFSQEMYGGALTTFKKRLGLEGDEDLYALSNVSMSPWPTATDFLKTIIDAFKNVAEEEIKTCLVRVTDQPSMHSFVIHGDSELYFVYISSFNVESYRQQVIVKATLSDTAALSTLQQERTNNPGSIYTFHTGFGVMSDLMTQKQWTGDIFQGLPTIYGSTPFLTKVSFDVEVVLNKSLHRTDLDKQYPGSMPFYLFGTSTETHMAHDLLRAPNVHLTASQIKLNLNPPLSDVSGKVMILDEQREDLMQPFNANHKPSFFSPNATLKVSVYDGPPTNNSAPISTGTVTLPAEQGKIFVDFNFVNLPAATEIHISAPPDATTDSGTLDGVATQIVKLFNDRDITWDDNVLNSINRLCSGAKDLDITLGSYSQHQGDIRSLSRFLGPIEGANKSLAENVGLVKSLQQLPTPASITAAVASSSS
ncbi:PLP-dependent transferase [Marasmius fiardii PR-910]|nr:PLP-dependent transferase [Marasmius fiardii PR-910]